MIQRIHDSGEVAKTYRYDAFGNEETPEPLDANPFRYCGEYFDAETATLYLRARSYDARSGRFTQEDSAKDGGNWYAYCANNPIKMVDSSGKTPKNAQEWAWNEVFGKPLRETQRRIDEWQYEYMQDLPDLQTVGDAIVDGATLVNGVNRLIHVDIWSALMDAGYIEGGIGTGLGLEIQGGNASIGLYSKSDLWAIQWTREGIRKFSTNESGASMGIAPISFEKNLASEKEGWFDGYSELMVYLSGEEWKDVSTDQYDWDGKIAVGASAYWGMGGSFEAGFNMNKFIESMGRSVKHRLSLSPKRRD